MDLLSKEDIERKESGSRFIPDSILIMLHPEVMVDASTAYSKLVMDNPGYEFGILKDTIKGGLTVYWKRIV